MSEVVIVNDHLVQRGGAERLVIAMSSALSGAPIVTSFYDPSLTYPEFESLAVRPMALDRVPGLRRHHRMALPLMAASFSALRVDAAVTLCCSGGWAHGARVTGRKLVYCLSPARWLYQKSRYLRGQPSSAARLLGLLEGPLLRWDVRAASSAHRYISISTVVRRRVEDAYRIDSEVLHPPVTFGPDGPTDPSPELEPGFFLCVSRLLSYKNVAEVISAFEQVPDERLVVVGMGPLYPALSAALPSNVVLTGAVDDQRLRWLYGACRGVIAASYEDFGLTPVEAAGFGKPVAAYEWGGFLDTVVAGETGIFFDDPSPSAIAHAVRSLSAEAWDEDRLRAHAARFSFEAFATRLKEVVAEEAAMA